METLSQGVVESKVKKRSSNEKYFLHVETRSWALLFLTDKCMAFIYLALPLTLGFEREENIRWNTIFAKCVLVLFASALTPATKSTVLILGLRLFQGTVVSYR